MCHMFDCNLILFAFNYLVFAHSSGNKLLILVSGATLILAAKSFLVKCCFKHICLEETSVADRCSMLYLIGIYYLFVLMPFCFAMADFSDVRSSGLSDLHIAGYTRV